MGKMLVVYDNTGRIYHWSVGNDIKAPEGLPYIILDNFESDGRNIKCVDVTQTPPVIVFEKTKEKNINI